MALTITDPRLIKLIEQRARERGTSVEQTIADALVPTPVETSVAQVSSEDLEREEARQQHIDEIVRDMREHVTDEMRNFDYDAWLYDEHGLPH